MRYICVILLSCFTLFAWSQDSNKTTVSYKKGKTFVYQNPIKNGIDKGMRDCQVFYNNGKYDLVGTSYPFWYWGGKKNPGVKIYSSSDLLNWNFEKLLIDRSQLDSTVWYLDRFRAPEIHKINGKYYLSFNCQNESTKAHILKGQLCGLAVAGELLGNYTVITHKKPLTQGNDLSLFEDQDGIVYAFFNRDKKIYVGEIDLQSITFVGEPKECIRSGDLLKGEWDGIGIEGAYCIHQGSKYYLFYSSWSRGYEIGYATADHPLGPWMKNDSNPVYGAQSEMKCFRNKIKFTGDKNSAWAEAGHNQAFTGPDGSLWISCHGI